MRNAYKVLSEKYDSFWDKANNFLDNYFVLSKVIDQLSDSKKDKEKYYLLKYKELVTDPNFDNSHWDMMEDEPEYAEQKLNYYYDYYFIAEAIDKYLPKKIANAINSMGPVDREDYLETNYPDEYRKAREKYIEKWKTDFLEWLNVQNAQRHHTPTHGVDLSNLEETKKDDYDLNKDAVETLSAIEDLSTFLKLARQFHKKGAGSSSYQFIDAVEAKFGDTKRLDVRKVTGTGPSGVLTYPDPNTIGGAFWRAYRKAAENIVWGVPEIEVRQAFDDWLEAKKVINAQQQHTATHGVDLTQLEESDAELSKDAVEVLSSIENWKTFIDLSWQYHNSGVHSGSSDFYNAIESKFGNINRQPVKPKSNLLLPDRNTVGGAFWYAFSAAIEVKVWYISIKDKEVVFNDWLEKKRIWLAQQQHTATHGVDLTQLEEKLGIALNYLDQNLINNWVALIHVSAEDIAERLPREPFGTMGNERARALSKSFWPVPSSDKSFRGVRNSFIAAVKSIQKFNLYQGYSTPIPGTFKKKKYNPAVLGSWPNNLQFTPGDLKSIPEQLKGGFNRLAWELLEGLIYELSQTDPLWSKLVNPPDPRLQTQYRTIGFNIVRIYYVAGRELDELERMYTESEYYKIKSALTQHTGTHGVDLSNLEEDSTKQEGIKTRRRNLIQALVALNNSEDSAKFAALALNNPDLLFVKEQASPGLYNLRFDIINIAEQVLGEKYTYAFNQTTLTDYFISLLYILADLVAGPVETKGFRFAKQLQPAALRKEYNKRFAIWVDANSAKKAQQQHTKTHGVDLSNLEEQSQYSDPPIAPETKELVAKLIKLHNPEQLTEFVNLVRANSETLYEYKGKGPPQFTVRLAAEELLGDKQTFKQYLTGPLTKTDHFISLFFDLSRVGDYKNYNQAQAKKDFTESFHSWCDVMKAAEAQRQHTSTHGVDLSNLE